MVQLLKRFCLVTVLALSVVNVPGAAFLGPQNEAYQVPVNGFNGNGLDGLPTGPKNLGEEYRRNTPIIYYSFDQNFIEYFGTNGMASVDAAFAVYNNLDNVSSYSADLSEFALEAQRVNYQAQALFLLDLKSSTMSLIAEQLGLAQPERYTWALHNRFHTGTPPCPAGQNYTVIKRNFDPVFSNLNQLQPSSYVNGTLYSYTIVEYCTEDATPITGMLSDAVEFSVDPLASTFTPVASGYLPTPYLLGGTAFSVVGGLGAGSYYTGLTRDDVGGLRYLLRSSNLNVESAGTNTITYVTNNNQLLLFTDDLSQFIDAATFLDAPELLAFYPDLQITSTTPIFTNIVTTNAVFYFTNSPFDPAGYPPRLITTTVVETNIFVLFYHTFGNVYITPTVPLLSNLQVPLVPGHTATNAIVTTITTNISSSACGAFTPPGTVCTNVSLSQKLTAGVFGDFYILPTNFCQVSIVATQQIRDFIITNFSDTLTVVFTNAQGQIVETNSFFSQTPSYPFKQYVYLVRPVVCPENTVALRQGIERVRFVRRDFDSLIGQFYYPTNHSYVLNAVTNNTLIPQTVTRQVTLPDLLITAQDLVVGPSTVGARLGPILRSIAFDEANTLAGLAGPGTITTPTAFVYDKGGPLIIHSYPALSEDTGTPLLLWGSFDGSTNAPVVYPNGASVTNIENQILLQVNPAGPTLPDGQVGVNYTNVFAGFTVQGGTAPYSWSLPNPLAGLPPGLSLNASTGVISGFPTTPNVYDFTVRMIDANFRFVDLDYTIVINP